jgi:hypothetical protein
MMDVELLAALAADNFELILVGSRFPPGTNGPVPTPQTMLDTGQGSDEERRENVRTLERGPPPPRAPPPANIQFPPASTRRVATSKSKRARLTSNRGQADWTKKTKDRTGTATHSQAAHDSVRVAVPPVDTDAGIEHKIIQQNTKEKFVQP